MIPTKFDYKRATSIDDAIALLKQSNGDGKLVAGGHSLVPLMKLRLSEPGVLVDIARIEGLSGIRQKDGAGGTIEIGATTTHTAVATSTILLSQAPVVAEAASEIGDPQVRNRGTLGGSLAHADPAADMPAVMVALDAEVHM
ncbi:MAG: FAD binding domain-containing protein, partial [Solimonas sp.]